MPLPLLKVYPIMRSTRRKIISRIIILYTLVSAVWILASDSILFALVSDPNVVRSISIYKGWVFIAITAVLLAGILYRELKNLEAAQNLGQESEQRFRLLYQDAPVGFHSLDSNAVILEVNRLWCETLGYSSDQVIGKPFSQFIAAVSQDLFRTTFDKINKRGKTSFETELEMLHANGSTILTSISGRVVRDPESGVPNIYCTLQNVTEQRLLVMETRQQREEYRKIIDTVPAHIFYLDPQQVVMRTNQAAALQLKSTPVELVGKPLRSLLPHYADLVDAGFQTILETGRPVLGSRHQVTGPDGRQIWISIDRLPYPGTNGYPGGVVVFVNDVTDQVRREKDLEVLVEMAAALRNLNQRTDIYQAVLRGIMDNLHVEGASIAMRALPDDDLVIVDAVGHWMQVKGQVIKNEQGMSFRTTHTGQAQLTQQVTEADSIDGMPYQDDIRAAGAVPLIAERHSLGALWVGSRSAIPEEDFRLLRAIADIAASALQRSVVNEQTQLRLRRVSALHYIDMAISSSFDWHVTLNVLLGQAVSMLGMDAAAILTYSPETQSLTYAAGQGFSGTAIQKTNLRMGESQAGQAAVKREVRYIPDLHKIEDSSFEQFFRSGEDFTTYCAAPLVGKGLVKGVLEVYHRSHFVPDPEWMDFFEMLAAQAAIAIDNAELFENFQKTNSELRQAYDSLIQGWSRGLELRDAESQGHSNRLVDYTVRLARRLRMPEGELMNLRRGVLLHDIGKMGIPDSILLKTGPLTEKEWEVMHQHPVFAFELLSSVSVLKSTTDVPYFHHERWDGSGYPRGLKGEEIPLAARLFAVVDIWDALTNDRPYRKAWDKAKVAEYLRERAGKDLDPVAVEAFMAILIEDGVIQG